MVTGLIANGHVQDQIDGVGEGVHYAVNRHSRWWSAFGARTIASPHEDAARTRIRGQLHVEPLVADDERPWDIQAQISGSLLHHPRPRLAATPSPPVFIHCDLGGHR